MALLVLVVKTSLILALGMLAALAFRRRSAAVRHWLLAATLICASTAPIVERLTPSWTLPAPSAPVAARGAAVDVSFTALRTPGAPTEPAPRLPASWLVRDLIQRAIVPAWVCGAVLNLLMLVIGMSRLRRLRSPHAALEDPAIGDSLQRVAATFGVRRPIELVRGSRPAVIVTWGALRPKVVLPADVHGWPRERVDVVLAHEVAHIARGDWLVQTVAEVGKAIYWFNPLFWIACARLRYESERACDDAVMAIGVTSHAYATELLELARSFERQPRAWLPAPAMAVRPSNLERRVRAMLNARLNRGPITRAGRSLVALGLFLVTVPIATFAQGGFATVSGTVVDPQDRVLPGATITVADARRDVKHETKSDRTGHFELVGLPAGDYSIEVKLPGFRTLHDVGAVNGQSVDLTLKMQVSELQETITVTSQDGSVTSTHQRGQAFARPANPVANCPANAANGVGGNLRPPRKIKDVAPGYPGVSGNVQLLATIGADGSVTDVQVVKADRPELAPSAIDAVRQWEFTSTLLNCVPIDVQMNVSISFLQNQ